MKVIVIVILVVIYYLGLLFFKQEFSFESAVLMGIAMVLSHTTINSKNENK